MKSQAEDPDEVKTTEQTSGRKGQFDALPAARNRPDKKAVARQRGRRRLRAVSEAEKRELRFPLGLICVAVVVFLGFGIYQSGLAEQNAATNAWLTLLVISTVTTALALLACFMVGFVLGTSFGTFKPVAIKLLGAIMFSQAAGMLLSISSPWLGLIVMVLLFLGLIKTMFDLELEELVALAVAYALVAAGVHNLITVLPEMF